MLISYSFEYPFLYVSPRHIVIVHPYSMGHKVDVKMYNKKYAIECMLKESFFESLSLCSKGHFMGPWAYVQRVIFWDLEHMFKGSFLGSLSICSKGHFWDPWGYAQRVISWLLEHMLKGYFWVLEHILKRSISSAHL